MLQMDSRQIFRRFSELWYRTKQVLAELPMIYRSNAGFQCFPSWSTADCRSGSLVIGQVLSWPTLSCLFESARRAFVLAARATFLETSPWQLVQVCLEMQGGFKNCAVVE